MCVVCLAVSALMCVVCLVLQVDKHIRRLDADLARFEQELKEKALSGKKGLSK